MPLADLRLAERRPGHPRRRAPAHQLALRRRPGATRARLRRGASCLAGHVLGLALAQSVEEVMVLVCLISFANSNTTISYTQISRYG